MNRETPFQRMNLEILGYIAAFLTSVSFIPQAVMTIKTRETHGISRGMYIMFTVEWASGWPMESRSCRGR